MIKTVIIQASSNSFGNTHKIIKYLNDKNQFDVIDIKTKNIGAFEYDFSNANDDFLPLMEEIIKKYDTIIFATPVYWYSMSGTLKKFFDRLSDLLQLKKELGKSLRGKNMAMLSNSTNNNRKAGFEMPFIETAKYLRMYYLGDVHVWFSGDEIAEDAKKRIDEFRKTIS